MDKQLKRLKQKQRSKTVNDKSRKRYIDPDWPFGLSDDEDYNLDVKKKKRDAHKNASKGKNYCNNNAQSKSTNRFSVEDYSMISKRLAKVEKRPQNKRQISVINTYGVPIVGKENNFGGAVSLSPRKTLSMGRFRPLRSSSFVWDSEPQPVMEFPTTLVTHHVNPSASYTNSTFFEKFREILNKLNSENVEKLYQEFLISVGPEDTFPELATVIFRKAIDEVDSPTSPTLYAELMARACNNVNMKNLSVKLRKASMDHFSELFDVKEASSSSSEFQPGDISTSRRRSKGILRFIGELFKVDIIPFSDMNYFVDWLLLHPEESNLHHLCRLLKLTGSLLETKSNAIESGIAAKMNSNHTHMPSWFAGVCAELERKKDDFNNSTKSAIMDILQLRDGKWTVQEPPNIENFLEPPKENRGGSTLWSETQQFSTGPGIEISSAAQQHTLVPVSNDYSDNDHMSLLNSSSQPMDYNQQSIEDNEEEETVASDSVHVLTCHLCNRAFVNSGELVNHLKKHKTGLPCTECGRFFPTTEKLAEHKERHNAFPCDECTKSFTTNSHLQLHVDFEHKGIFRFVCEQCGKPFLSSTILNNHIAAHANPNSRLNKREQKEAECDPEYELEPHEEVLAEAEIDRLNKFCASIREAKKQGVYKSQFLVPVKGTYYSKSKKDAPLVVENNVEFNENLDWTAIALIPVEGEDFGTLMCISKNIDPISYIRKKICASLKSKVYASNETPCIGIRETITKDNYKYDYTRARFLNIFCNKLAAEELKRTGVQYCKNTNKLLGHKLDKVDRTVLKTLIDDYVRCGIPINDAPLREPYSAMS